MYLEDVICAVRDRAVVNYIEGFVMISRSSLPQSIRGFTVVELLVVIAIMAIVVVVAAPNITKTLSNQRAKSASYELVQTLQSARTKAIITRRNVDIRATYPSTSTNNAWNGAKTGNAVNTNVATADLAKIDKTSYYILETGIKLDNATTGITDNRVTLVAKLPDSVTINAAIGLIRFTPDSSVFTSTAVGTAPTQLSATGQTFVVKDTGYSSSAGYTVTLNRFGGTQVKKN